MTATIVSKLRTVFPHYSPKMRAIVECFCSMKPTVSPHLVEIAITSDGYVIAYTKEQRDIFIGSASDLYRNLNDLLNFAGLTPAERAEVTSAAVGVITDWRTIHA